MKQITVRNVVIGSGMPKICIPMIKKTRQDLLQEAQAIKKSSADLAEWRMDHFEEVLKHDSVLETLQCLHDVCLDIPVIATCRTKREGGALAILTDAYTSLVKSILDSGQADIVDVEWSAGEAVCRELIFDAHTKQIPIILSHHDFEKTPSYEDMYALCHAMQNTNADIIKLAVMPRSNADVLSLLKLTDELSSTMPCPIITMAMGKIGSITRVSGEYFGSCMSFGCISSNASAPGQIEVEDLRQILELLHKNC